MVGRGAKLTFLTREPRFVALYSLGLLWFEKQVCCQCLASIEFRADHTPEQKRLAIAMLSTLLDTLTELEIYYQDFGGASTSLTAFESDYPLPYPLTRYGNRLTCASSDRLLSCGAAFRQRRPLKAAATVFTEPSGQTGARSSSSSWTGTTAGSLTR